MKKKIFLLIMVVSVLLCLFAISVSAADYDTTRKVTLDSGETVALYDENGNALSYYNDGTKIVAELTTNIFKWDGSGWLVMKDASVVNAASLVVINLQDPTLESTASSNFGFNISFRDSTNLEYVFFSNVIKKFNGSYAFSNCDKMKVFEITADSQLESFSDYIFYNNQVLETIHIPTNVTYLTNSNDDKIGFISQCPNLTTVTFGDNCKLETITRAAFYKCTSLVNLTIPDGTKTIMRNAFRETGIINSPFTENSRCEVIGQHAFRNCDSLNNFIVPRSLLEVQHESEYGLLSESDNVKLVTFGKYVHPENGAMTVLPHAMFGKANIEKVVLPEGITHIGSHTFTDNKAMKEIVFPNSLVTAEQRVFQSCSALETIVFGSSFKYFINTSTDHGSFTYGANNIKNIYLPASFYAEAPETAYRVSYMFSGGGHVKFFYTGTQEQIEDAIEIFKTSTTNATDNNGNFLNATIISKAEYDANPSNYESGDYIIYGYNTCEAFYNGVHGESQVRYDFEGEDYTTNLLSFTGCSRCNDNIEAFVCGPLFTNKGYSKVADGSMFTYGISINEENIKTYKSKTGNTFSYGFIVGAVPTTPTGNIIDVNGNALIEKSLVVDFAAVQFSNFTIYNVKMCDIDTTQQTMPVYCCAYIIDGSQVSYIGNSVTTVAASISSSAIEVIEKTTPPAIGDQNA